MKIKLNREGAKDAKKRSRHSRLSGVVSPKTALEKKDSSNKWGQTPKPE